MNDIIGSYRVVRKLGCGGMGSVYEVVHLETGEHRAMKVFTLDHGNREFLRKRFLAEAKILEKLDHPHLVKVRELAIANAGETPYFVMDLVLNSKGDPQTLEDKRKAGKFTEKDVLDWYEDLRDGLDYIHSCGIVHRDVKLENVLIDTDGHAVLSDFGVSRIFDERMRNELMVTTTFISGVTTGTQPVMGTYWYLSPEIRKGGEASAASDWYALGVLMYRLLTGMWYEPNTKAFDLLAPFSKRCQRIVRCLLSDKLDERIPVVADRHKTGRRSLGRKRVVASGIIMLGAFIGWYGISARKSLPQSSLDVTASPGPSLHYCKGVDFAFCSCPKGTNMLGKTSLVVTRPYWLGVAPVTWRQWRAVRGEHYEGGWNGKGGAPATYLSQEEAKSFCVRLTKRFAKELPDGYEIRLPTIAEWRLAYQVGQTVTNQLAGDTYNARKTRYEVGWFGQGINGMEETSNMRRYFEDRKMPVQWVSETWPEFPPRQIEANGSRWIRYSSKIVPVPVRQKPPNRLGLYDMYGNCFEMCLDQVSTNNVNLFASEFGFRVRRVYSRQDSLLMDPVELSGSMPAMLGTYITPGLSGDDVWSTYFDRLPHLGFRLCIGPKLNPSSSDFQPST